MTQKELADKLGWKTSRVSKVLHGTSNLTLKTIFDVCEALETDFDVQIGGQSQLKQELEVVQLKHEQMDTMLKTMWQSKWKGSTPANQKYSPVYNFAS